jgi:hypothetical protein
MSVLAYKGDTIGNFGKYLPTPYIEKIEVHDDLSYQVNLALFVIVDPNEEVDSVIERLKTTINNYILLVVNKPPRRMESLLNGDRNPFNFYKVNQLTDNLVSKTTLGVLDFFEDGGEITDDFYDEHGNRILKFSLCYGCEGTAGSFDLIGGESELKTSEYGSGVQDSTLGPAAFTLSSMVHASFEKGLLGDDYITPAGTFVGTEKEERKKRQIEARHAKAQEHKEQWIASAKAAKAEAAEQTAAGLQLAQELRSQEAAGRQLAQELRAQEAEYGLQLAQEVRSWDNINNFTVLAFSSTFDYFDAPDEDLENFTFFTKRISDLAYEKVVEDGQLYTRYLTEFFDASDTIYNGKPLRSIAGNYYKTKIITHDKIINQINGLLSEYQAGTGDTCAPAPSSPPGKILNSIYYTLNTYKKDPVLLSELNKLVKVFPSKNGATKVGKLYFRYSKRIAALNKALQGDEQLHRKVIRNPKILDLRSKAPTSGIVLPDYVANYKDRNFLYTKGLVGRTALYSLPGRGQLSESEDSGLWGYDPVGSTETNFAWEEEMDFDSIVRNFGYFFFDYEKALRKTAKVNQIVNLSKMMKWGIPQDYKHYRVSNASIVRNAAKLVSENRLKTGATGPPKRVVIGSNFVDASFPMTAQATIDDNSQNGDLVIFSPGFYSDYEPHGPDADLVLTDQEYTYLMIRNFEPVQARAFSPQIPRYRLMCFEFQDFMDDDFALNSDTDSYEIEVVIADNSIEILREFVEKYKNSWEALQYYRDSAAPIFSYDETTGLFNEFFVEGIEARYTDNRARAPWKRAPVLFNMHKDLLYNTFGGSRAKIIEASRIIMDDINPYNGNFYALEQFVNEMSVFYKNNYSRKDPNNIQGRMSALDAPSVQRFNNTLTYVSSGTTEEPYGVIYEEHEPTAEEREEYAETHTAYKTHITGERADFYEDFDTAASSGGYSDRKVGRKQEEFREYILTFKYNGQTMDRQGWYLPDYDESAGYARATPEGTIETRSATTAEASTFGSAAGNKVYIGYWARMSKEGGRTGASDPDTGVSASSEYATGYSWIEKVFVIADGGSYEIQ